MRDVALYELYHSKNIQRTKSKRMEWTGQVTSRGRTEMRKFFWKRNLKIRDYWQILCRWEGYINKDLKENGKKELGGLIWLRMGTNGDLL